MSDPTQPRVADGCATPVPADPLPHLPDYSEWLTPERLAVEEQLWAECGYYYDFAAGIYFACWQALLKDRISIPHVIEYGCGTGWVPTLLPPHPTYLGIDANVNCLVHAQNKNLPARRWLCLDFRTFTPSTTDHLACSFSVLKHFHLSEWDAVVSTILRPAAYGVFTMPIGPALKEDGVEFPHTWVTDQYLREAVEGAGHRITKTQLQRTGETMVWTQRHA